MYKIGILVLVMASFSLGKAFGGTLEQEFWTWFTRNQEMLFNFESDRETVFDKLATEMHKVHSDLTFEFSPIKKSGKREFVISAGGIKDAFPAVQSLYATAPSLENWEFIKFRPRRTPLNDIQFGGKEIKVKDVYYRLFKDGDDKVGIIVFIPGYTEAESEIYANIGYLLLDESLGEYDVETKLGFIEIHSYESKYFEGARPLSELASHVDDYFSSITH